MSEEHIPFSQACENNKAPILKVLKRVFAQRKKVLEIGSGTGQHAVYFAKHLPHLIWQTADQAEYHPGILYWMAQYPTDNLLAPIQLSIPVDDFPNTDFDAYFTANTAHIMQKHEVENLMQTINTRLPKQGIFCQYGPFTQQGQFNSQSNEAFHYKLLATGRGGYRDVDELRLWAPQLYLSEIIDMPANNHLLVWERK